MKTRLLTVMLVLAFVVALVPAASAQDDMSDVDICYDLPQADCDILLAATANSDNITAFDMELNANFALGGVSALSPGTPDVNGDLTGTGSIVMTPDAVPPIAMTFSGQANMTGEETINLDFIIVDGIFYIANPENPDQWAGMPIADALAQADSPVPLEPLLSGEDPSAMLGDVTSGLPEMGNMAEIPGFITHTRLADEELMGQTAYPFSLDIDFKPFFESEQFNTLMNEAMSMAGGAAGDDPAAAQIMMMAPMILEGTDITANLTQWVGADDNFIHKMSGDLNASVDLSALMGAAGAGDDAPEMPPITLDAHFDVTLSNINGDINITAPENAQMVPMN